MAGAVGAQDWAGLLDRLTYADVDLLNVDEREPAAVATLLGVPEGPLGERIEEIYTVRKLMRV